MTDPQRQLGWSRQLDAPQGSPTNVFFDHNRLIRLDATSVKYDEASKLEYIKDFGREELQGPINWLGEVEIERLQPGEANNTYRTPRPHEASPGPQGAAETALAQQSASDVCKKLITAPPHGRRGEAQGVLSGRLPEVSHPGRGL